MKKLFTFLLAFACIISTTACGNSESSVESSSEATIQSTETVVEGGFYVEGTKLMDANGNEFIMRGVNHAHTWFKDEMDTALEAIAKTGSNTVRVVLSNGVQWTKDSAEEVAVIVEKCKELNMVSVLEVHDATGRDSVSDIEKATDYWVELKDVLIGNEAYVILNIANEWVGSWDSEIWRDGYVSAIETIRSVGIENTIMVDSAGWGQYGQSIADFGTEVFNSDPLKNTMFSIHMYGTAGKNQSTIKKNIDGVLNKNLCLIIGEFGYNHSDGDVDESFIMSYCNDKNVGYLGWSWKGNGGGVEYLDIANEWDGSVLSSDWGEPLIEGENGIRKTSKLCTIFE